MALSVCKKSTYMYSFLLSAGFKLSYTPHVIDFTIDLQWTCLIHFHWIVFSS